MDYRALPESTGAVVRGLPDVDPATAIRWARDCWQSGFETDAIKALAILDAEEGDAIRATMQAAVQDAGLTEAAAHDHWAERWLLSCFANGILSDLDLMCDGFQLWTSFRERSGDDAPNPFDVYFSLDLDAFEITQGDIKDVPIARRRPWVIRKLVEAGAFVRTGVQPPLD